MDPRELHRETVRLIKVMQNVKDSDMGISIKRAQIKKLKKELLNIWIENKDMIPMTNLPSKNIVMSIAQGYDQKNNTNYHDLLFNDLPKENSISEYSDVSGSDIYSEDVYSECLTDRMTELTV